MNRVMSLPRPVPDALVELIAHRMQVLGQPLRIRVIDLLDQRGETTVQAIADQLGTSSQNVSKHLSQLRRAGVLTRRQDGRTVWYALADRSVISLYDHVAQGLGRQLHELSVALGATPPAMPSTQTE
jgi:DNA-binding transcriptional ArsR family regulator